MRRLVSAALLLYPRAVRRRHGAELECLVEELIEREGAWRPAVLGRLAADGLIQRLSSRATAWAVGLTLLVTGVGGLAVSDFSAASAHQRPVLRSLARDPGRRGAVDPRRRAGRSAQTGREGRAASRRPRGDNRPR